ncbi:MAG: polyketide synthase, partial [Dehalococcoidia bacterium]|nr:polyketide synthase [Dehalococcoidia bacterium]
MAREGAGAVPTSEPVAIIGMACRFPGANDIDAFWRLLEAGESAVIEGVPGSGVGRIGELFPDADVQSEACRFGAYLDEIDQFDASFFRISPIEAQMLDPQQRMMLETSWQALEDAGIDPDGLAGSRTGVYAGISNNEYRNLILDTSATAEPAASLYSVTGTSFNTAIGRVAFALGLQGPALAVDTACSSSLVAVHQAVVGLQRQEADLALAGGVHAILSGRLLEMRANAGMLAPDGRCKTFDAAANGYVRGEGCGILVLKRLSDAEADGDRIWAVVRGAALNQDGASPGLTVPSGPAQQQVIVDALARADIEAGAVDYVEAHGTGTPVGDPIEAEATGTAYSQGRDRPLLIGSVKTNLGHLEAAAGSAALIKVALAMKHGVIPRHLNYREPNPAIPWERLPLQVTAEPTEWPIAGDRPPLAGISGFGWSGTNAHVVLEGYGAPEGTPGASGSAAGAARPVELLLPPPAEGKEEAASPARATRLLPLSGKSDGAVRDLASLYLEWLDDRSGELEAPGGDAILADMAWTASVGRSQLGNRAGVPFRDAASLREALTTVVEGEHEPGAGTATKVAFAYTGQASQWVGMGAALY